MQVQLVRAWPHRCERVEIEVDEGACVGDALARTAWALDDEFVALVVFSLPVTPQTPLHDGDRIELLRKLHLDPMQARRRRAVKP